MTYLLDTNVLSETCKREPEPRVLTWLGDIGSFALSAISVAEVNYGLTFRPNARIQRVLERYLRSYSTVHGVTEVIAKHAGLLRGQLARKGKVRSQADMLIAATAAAHGLMLATRNERDFDGCGVALYNPFR